MRLLHATTMLPMTLRHSPPHLLNIRPALHACDKTRQLLVTDSNFVGNMASGTQSAGGALLIVGAPPFSTTMSKSTFVGNTAVQAPAGPVVCIGRLGQPSPTPRAKAKVSACTGLVVPSKLPYRTTTDCNVAALTQSP